MAITKDAKPKGLWIRLAWFAGIWIISVAALGVVAWMIRAVLL
ncbi:MAG: DUF2474 family protein [Salaquimonas sp.]